MNVFDASALLAFLQGENGSEVVETALEEGGVCGAANWSEVAQRARARDRDWSLARSLLLSDDLDVEAVTVDEAEGAASRWTRGGGRSLADRLCLALADRLRAVVFTADRSWGTGHEIRQIR